MPEHIGINGVQKQFDGVFAVEDVSLSIERGEIFSLLGPSGCGKTTLLRMIAGFLQPDAGSIHIGGLDITNLPPNRRPVNTVFQNYALFPHLSIWDNVAYGLKIAGKPKQEIANEVERMLQLTQMESQAKKKPHQLSGGQKQRIAIARALVNKPQVLLLDEPLAALDLKLRQRMLVELDRIHDEVGITFIFVTHDQGEAMSLSDRIAVVNHGRIEQVGTPTEIYEAPRTAFVADFIGDTNLFQASVSAIPDNSQICQVHSEAMGEIKAWKDRELAPGQHLTLSLRPEKISISRDKPPPSDSRNVFEASVQEVVYVGPQTKYVVSVGSQSIKVLHSHQHYLLDTTPIRWDEKVWISWDANDSFMIPEEAAL